MFKPPSNPDNYFSCLDPDLKSKGQFNPILATWPSRSVLSKLSMTLTSQTDLNPISHGPPFVPFFSHVAIRINIFQIEFDIDLKSKIVSFKF